VVLPWKTAGGGKAVVNITAYNITSNGKAVLLDFKVYNLTDMLAGSRGTRVVVTLPLNFGKVAANAYNIVTKRWTIKYVIEFQMYDPKRSLPSASVPLSWCLLPPTTRLYRCTSARCRLPPVCLSALTRRQSYMPLTERRRF
jgi:hypothetical protein